MDAHDWHRQAQREPDAGPEPLSSPAFAALSAAEQKLYLQAVAAALEGIVLPTQSAAEIGEQLSALVATNSHRPPGAMLMAALSAPFTTGKSTLIKQWAQQHYREILGDQLHTDRPTWRPQPNVVADWWPVIYVTLRAASTVKDVLAQLLLFCGYPPEGVTRTTITRVLNVLKIHAVRLVIIDDAHFLKTSNVRGREVLDFIKFLNSELGETNGTVILVGADMAATAILDDPQIRGRLRVLQLRPEAIDTVAQRRRWQRFLKGIESTHLRYLPGAAPGLFSQQLPEPIWRRTQGYVGDTATLTTGAVLRAIETGASTITSADLDLVALSERAVDAQQALSTETIRPAKGRSRART